MRARFPVICLLLFFSGASGLIYEVVWVRMCIRIFGCTAYATAVVLATFMGGMALGSWWLGRRADRIASPLRLYALLEVGAALSALVVPFLFPLLLPVYRAVHALTDGSRAALTLAQAILVALALIVPTSLMGGTLPVISAFAARDHRLFGKRIATLYGVNTLGAVLGTAGAGFVLLGSLGEMRTILVAAILQLGVAVVAWRLAARWSLPFLGAGEGRADRPAGTGEGAEQDREPPRISPYPDSARRLALWGFAVSGFAALGYEIVWTRVLPVMLLTSIYTVTAMLSLYLIGIGVGSLLGRRLAGRAGDPLLLFALLEGVVALLSLVGLLLMVPVGQVLQAPVADIGEVEFYRTFHRTFPLRLLVAAVVILPTTLVLGMLFPVVARCFARDERTVGSSVGRLYAMNTAGCIAGSLACGFVLLPWLGSTRSIVLLALMNLAVSFALFFSGPLRLRRRRWAGVVLLLGVGTVAAAVALRDPFLETIEARVHESGAEVYFHREEVQATTTVTGVPEEPRRVNLWVNGEGMTVLSTETKLMAYVPLLVAREPRDMLILCFGMGTTFRSAMVFGNLNVDTVELVPGVYESLRYFHADAPPLLEGPRVRRIVDDARSFLTLSDRSYDVITIDPPPPVEAAGVVSFYSREFHSLCRKRLRPGGVVCLWIPPAPGPEMRMILRTFAESYPHVTVWGGPRFPGFYLLGSPEPQKVRPDRFFRLLARDPVRRDLQEYDTSADTAPKILGLQLGTREELLDFTDGSPVVTDDLPLTEFPLWRRLEMERDFPLMSAFDFVAWKRERGTWPPGPAVSE